MIPDQTEIQAAICKDCANRVLDIFLFKESLDYALAHNHCRNNKEELARSSSAACFMCLKAFLPGKVKEYVGADSDTALCPHCGIDSVLGDGSGYPISADPWLVGMKEVYFGKGRSVQDIEAEVRWATQEVQKHLEAATVAEKRRSRWAKFLGWGK